MATSKPLGALWAWARSVLFIVTILKKWIPQERNLQRQWIAVQQTIRSIRSP
jgi:hypothetical protein